MYVIAKNTKNGYKYLEYIDNSGSHYFGYNLHHALSWGIKLDADAMLRDIKQKGYMVCELGVIKKST